MSEYSQINLCLPKIFNFQVEVYFTGIGGSMSRYIFRRLLMLLPVILGVSLLIFFLMNMAPGDPVDVILSSHATEIEKAELRSVLGLDKPVLVQYFNYVAKFFKGDLGNSYITGIPVLETYFLKLPNTALLAVVSMLFGIITGVPLGAFAALNQNTWKDTISVGSTLIGQSMPDFWFGLLIMYLFSLRLKIFPSSGFDDGWRSLILPMLTVGMGLNALLARMTRSAMLDVLGQDYLRTARSKGAKEKTIIWVHAFRNALIPIVTSIGTSFGICLGGSVVTEAIYGWPGVGKMIMDGVNNRDIPTVTGGIIMTTIILSIVLLLVDLVYAYLDPRIKAQYVRGEKTV